jgi:hypothetical protein
MVIKQKRKDYFVSCRHKIKSLEVLILFVVKVETLKVDIMFSREIILNSRLKRSLLMSINDVTILEAGVKGFCNNSNRTLKTMGTAGLQN